MKYAYVYVLYVVSICRLGPCHLSIGDGQLGSTFEDALRRADKNHASPKATSIRPVPAQRLHGPFRTAARSDFNPVSPTSHQKHANLAPETRQLCTRNIPATPSLSSATSAFRESVPLPVRPLNVASPSACSMTRYGQRHGEGLSHHRSWIGFYSFAGFSSGGACSPSCVIFRAGPHGPLG